MSLNLPPFPVGAVLCKGHVQKAINLNHTYLPAIKIAVARGTEGEIVYQRPLAYLIPSAFVSQIYPLSLFLADPLT